jgi:AAA domain, putative AbiEii toxin, Type IV TA system
MTSNPSPAAPLAPLRIEIGGSGSSAFKSIDELVWENIPSFAVLTGLNGAGKTHLLELLAYKLTGTPYPNLDLAKVKLTVSGDSFAADSVAYLPSRWDIGGSPALGIAQIQNAKRELFQQLRQPGNSDLATQHKRAKIERLLGVTNLLAVDLNTFLEKLPDDFLFMLSETDIGGGLVHVFLGYRLKVADLLEKGVPFSDVEARLGPAPWDVVNETFQAAEFPYRVVSPRHKGLLEPYEFLLEDPQSGLTLRPTELSSGEKMLLGLVLWLYNSQHQQFPRLFLMDEPDAYLHPSMTRHFLSVVQEVLVERYNVRVILVTHSPSTVALTPEVSLFEMSRTKPRITASKSKADTIGLLTAGLVIVSAGTRYVLVEDEDDVQFYDSLRAILTDYGPSRDLRAIKPSPTLVFLPASLGKGSGKIGGGKNVVLQWVEKFDQPPLDELVRGITDRDTGNVATNRIPVLGRYSIENYLLDPFNVFGVLLEEGIAPPIGGVSISQGDEHRIRTLAENELQSILDAVRALLEPALSGLTSTEKSSLSVSFTNGKIVNYPRWMIDRRGHDLLPAYQAALGGPKLISPPRLIRSLSRVRLLPEELAEIFEILQS